MSAEYWAQLNDNNVVVQVAVVTQEYMSENPSDYTGRWVQTYFDTPGKTYAGVGFQYDEEAEDFIAPPVIKHQETA